MTRSDEPHRPIIAEDPDRAKAVHVDLFQPLDDRTILLIGWLWDPFGDIDSIELRSGGGATVELLERLHRFGATNPAALLSAEDLDAALERPGFVVVAELPEGEQRHEGHHLRVRRGEAVFDLALPPPQLDPYRARDRLLGDLPAWLLRDREILTGFLGPALARLQSCLRRLRATRRVRDLGVPLTAPDVSIIVPIYRRTDFVEAQLAGLADDPELRTAELLYVLDSPELADGFAEEMFHHHRLFRRSLRIIEMERNAGYAAANNVGAAHARGRHLVLLNSDVVPDRPGWLSRMRTVLTDSPRAGIVGAKLIYDDGSLQHAGMYYSREHTSSGLWVCHHYFKGLHRDLPEATIARPVPAVTGACILIERDLYTQLGGLSEDYVIGDFEDSDLCLKARAAGREVWYAADAELYHLEGQSYGPIRERAQLINRWLHDSRWRGEIAALMQRSEFDPALRIAGMRSAARRAGERPATIASPQPVAPPARARRRSSNSR